MTIDVGQSAPDFTLPTDDGHSVTLSAYRGQPVVVYFYPRADTPGCTKEACGFTDALPDLGATGSAVIGISRDPVTKLAKFRDKHGLKITLASDETTETIAAYGAWVEKTMYGKKSMGIDRSTFLIDRDGIVRYIWRKVRVPGHVEAVVDAIKRLHTQ